MAGSKPGDPTFGARFRSKIRAAMEMGMPGDDADRPTFYFADPAEYTPSDQIGEPYDWDDDQSNLGEEPPAGIQVLCGAEELGAGSSVSTSLGDFDPNTMFLKFFEDEWALVEDFVWVSIGGNKYMRGKQLRPLGLFDVTVRRVQVTAVDES